MITFRKNCLLLTLCVVFCLSIANAQILITQDFVDEPVVGISISAGGDQTWEYTMPVEEMNLVISAADLKSNFSLDVLILSKKFDGGNFILNGNAKNAILEARKYPEIRFKSESVSVDSLGSGEMRQAEVTGMLTLHGVEREIVLPVEFQIVDQSMTVKSEFSILTTDYGMRILEGFGFRLDDQINLSLDLVADLSNL